eukprot:10930129-Alexandrium_andersonii.AAC.1
MSWTRCPKFAGAARSVRVSRFSACSMVLSKCGWPRRWADAFMRASTRRSDSNAASSAWQAAGAACTIAAPA